MNNSNPVEVISQHLIDTMVKDQKVRVAITKENFFYFFNLYFAHYVKFPTAPFQREILQLVEQPEDLFIVAFRSSGKSTMITTAYPIWSILGKQQKKFILMLFQTQSQARQHLKNLRYELENNELLKNDLGPFQEESDEWGAVALVFNESNARIAVASTEQSVRGLRHHQHRPDLIICDDLESLASVKTLESRDKVSQWLTGDVIPAGDKNTRLIIVGNLLHEDSLLMRIKKNLGLGMIKGIFKEYPLLDKDDNILWQGKYTTMKSIQDEKQRIGNEGSWQREYLLKIVYPEDQIIKREWITYYDTLPTPTDSFPYRRSLVAVDLGIKQNENSDPTAIVCGRAFGFGVETKIYISPEFFNKKVPFLEIIENSKRLSLKHDRSRIIVEDVAAQNYVLQQIRTEGFLVEGFKPRGDKSERLNLISPLIQDGRVVFHRGCEEIINQIVNFGVERHDDLCDALVMLVTTLMEEVGHGSGKCVSGNNDHYDSSNDSLDEIVDRMMRRYDRMPLPGSSRFIL